MFTAYIDRVQNYENVLEKNFPKAVKVYRTFFDGMKDFYSDMKRYLKIARIATTSPLGLKALNRQELELYMQMPRDMVKVAPAIVITSLPFVGYAIFPLIFGFPRIFLSHHFWNSQQKVEFQQYYASYRLTYNKPVFRLLQSKLDQIKDDPQSALLDNIFGLIGSGFHPSVDNILAVKEIFAKQPLEYDSLSMKHIVSIFFDYLFTLGLKDHISTQIFPAFICRFLNIPIPFWWGIPNFGPCLHFLYPLAEFKKLGWLRFNAGCCV